MAEDIAGYALDPRDWETFQKLLQDYRNGKLGAKTTTPQAPAAPVMSLMQAILLDDLNAGEEVPAAKLERVTGLDVWDIQYSGWLSGPNSSFRVTIPQRNASSELIPVLASAQQAFDILASSPNWRSTGLSEFLHSVTIGNDGQAGYVPCRWRIALHPMPPDQNGVVDRWRVNALPPYFPRLTDTIGTGETVSVHAAFPTPDPTPLRLGTQVVCGLFPTGWGVIAAEPRRFVTAIRYFDESLQPL